jgi:hypothetical protein
MRSVLLYHLQDRAFFIGEEARPMATHKYRPADEQSFDPYKAQPLPLERPVAVYYRQSSEGQIGNISTTLQTVDMVEHLMRQGWERDRILMMDLPRFSGGKEVRQVH